jgi:hypothetical protein
VDNGPVHSKITSGTRVEGEQESGLKAGPEVSRQALRKKVDT